MRKRLPLLFVILVSWWAIRPLFHQGFFPVHDRTQVARVNQMAKVLRDGQFPARWVPDLGYGYGYPLYNFYAPLPYYVGGMFSLLGVDDLISTKIMFGIGILLSGVFMYLLGKKLFCKETVGILSAVLYVYGPYHAVDIYVRGAVGEFWAMAFIPLVVLGVTHILIACRKDSFFRSTINIKVLKFNFRCPKDAFFGVIIGSIGLSGTILSHNIIGMLSVMAIFIFLLVYSSYVVFAKKNLISPFLILLTSLLGLGIAAFFWLPAFKELQYTNVATLITGGSDFRDHFVYLDQLWNSPWGYAGSAPDRLDGLSFMLGKIHIIGAFVSFVLFLIAGKKAGVLVQYIFLIVVLIASIGMMTKWSQPVWEWVYWLAFIQFPWRFLVFATFSISLLAASSLRFVNHFSLITTLLIVLLIVFVNSKYFKPESYLNKSSKEYTNQSALQWDTSKIFDEYMSSDFKRPVSEDQIASEVLKKDKNINIDDFRSATERIYSVKSTKHQLVTIPLAYFPGWSLFFNNTLFPVKVKRGRIAIWVEPGETQVHLLFHDTLIRKIANSISLLSLIIIFGLVYARKKASC